MEYQFRPIESWPCERTKIRSRSKFRASWSQTTALLERELKHLRAKNVVIQADCLPSEIRLDGMLRSNAKLNSPAVILSFESRIGPLSYPCDRFTDWQDNIRAIACSLEALRSVDRYGVTRRSEQYRGWARIPGPAEGTGFTTETAKAFIEKLIDCRVEWSRDPYRSNAIRRAKILSHPDQGGSALTFKQVCDAAKVLGID